MPFAAKSAKSGDGVCIVVMVSGDAVLYEKNLATFANGGRRQVTSWRMYAATFIHTTTIYPHNRRFHAPTCILGL